jgi:hypothetical protein
MIRTPALAALSILFVAAAAGCGGGAKPPSVANLSTTTSNSTGSAGSGSTLFPPGIGGPGATMSTEVGTGAAGVAYSACMRSHGVSPFPDPNGQGVITITISSSLNPSSPLFQKAAVECQHLVPAGKAPSAAQQQQHKATALAFAACMRSHGEPNYPDPTVGSGGMISQKIDGRSGLDPRSPKFRAAQTACQNGRPG